MSNNIILENHELFRKTVISYLKETKRKGLTRSEALRSLVETINEDDDRKLILEVIKATKIIMDEIHYC